MELANIFVLFVVYIQYQNVSGFVPPYQMQYLETVTVPWPYNHYYPIYQQQPKQFNEKQFFPAFPYSIMSPIPKAEEIWPKQNDMQSRTQCGLIKPLCPVLKFSCSLCQFYLSTKTCRKTCQISGKYCEGNDCSSSSSAISISPLKICEEPGECVDSVFLGSLPANDSMDCLKKCQSYKGCSYGTFRPDSNVNLCLLFQTCTRLETDLCPNCLTSHSLCGKYLIAGGWVRCLHGPHIGPCPGFQDKITEVVEIIKTNSTPSFGLLPDERIQAVGGVIGNVPIICGGRGSINPSPPCATFFDSCITFQNSQWSVSHYMNEKRSTAAGVQINSTTIWILGGENCGNFLDSAFIDSEPLNSKVLNSTEFILQGQTNGVPGPKLPYALDNMCAVKLSDEEIFVIGGWDGWKERDEVWIYNPLNGFARNQGPSLNTRRYSHSCGIMTDGERNFIVVAGGYNIPDVGDALTSVEIYNPTDKMWHAGPELPYGLYDSAMAKSSDGKGVMLFGGFRTKFYHHDNEILELRFGATSWSSLQMTLKQKRGYHTVIPLQ